MILMDGNRAPVESGGVSKVNRIGLQASFWWFMLILSRNHPQYRMTSHCYVRSDTQYIIDLHVYIYIHIYIYIYIYTYSLHTYDMT